MEKIPDNCRNVRIDKWLWAVRLFKTRNQASEACRKGRVIIDEIPVKPSRTLREGEIISLRRPPAVYIYRVKNLVDKRQSAKFISGYLEDLTPEDEREKSLKRNLVVFSKRDRGSGRPTKKERRTLDRFNNRK